jgi:uncharacterized protein YjbI with pentapeptide repeats
MAAMQDRDHSLEEKDAHKGEPKPWTLREFGGKTLWDWLQLLIVPVVLSLITVVFAWQQDQRQQQTEDQRAKVARETEEQRAQDEALQTYLDVMGELLLTEDLDPLDEDSADQQKNRQVRTLARARSLAILERLDPERKASVIGFLYENTLLSDESPMVDLSDADLRSLSLRDGVLNSAYLGYVDLRHADLSHASLLETNFELAHLEEADLSGTNMGSAYLLGAELDSAELNGADLRGANLIEADLTDADLSGAVLRGAKGITKERLELETPHLGLTTMPGGTVHAGQYVNREVEPALSFIVGDGWRRDRTRFEELFGGQPISETPHISINGPEGGQIIFTNNPSNVFELSNLSNRKSGSTPDNADEWVSWFQRHPNLETSEPVSVSMGGASAMRINVTPTSTPENYPRDVCGEQACVPLYPLGDESVSAVYEGFKNRFIIVDVGGETVVIHATAQTDKFDEFLPKAQKVLDTVKWQE